MNIFQHRAARDYSMCLPTAQTPHCLPLCAYLPAVFYRVHVSEWLLVTPVVVSGHTHNNTDSTMHNHLGIKRRKTEHFFESILTASQLLTQLQLQKQTESKPRTIWQVVPGLALPGSTLYTIKTKSWIMKPNLVSGLTYLPFPCLNNASISSNVLFLVSGTFLYVKIQKMARNTLNGRNV